MTSQRTAGRLSRILAMLPWVIANPGVGVDEVCDRFGYTRGELASDLELVFVCGLPGYGPGDLMVAYIDDDRVIVELADYFADPVRLSPPEALTLLAAGMALISSGQAPAALERAVAKLQRVVLPEDGDALVVDLSEPPLVDVLRKAAVTGRAVEITYTAISNAATTVRVVEPWAVFSTLGNWYVRGHCRLAGAERVFRVDRVKDARLTDSPFVPPSEPPRPEIGYTPGAEDVGAVIRLGQRARWVAEYYPVEVVDDDEAGLTVRFSASDPLVVARLLLRLGQSAELVSGPEIAAARDTLRRRIIARYEPA